MRSMTIDGSAPALRAIQRVGSSIERDRMRMPMFSSSVAP
jgi:hypothetical protein